MLLSIHIPKTAGTAFRLFIERNIHDAAGFDYRSPETDTPALIAARDDIKAGEFERAHSRIAAADVELIHGHGAEDFAPLYPDAPAILWLRDPLERAISEFLHHRRHPSERHAPGRRIAAGELDFDQYVATQATLYARAFERLGRRPTAVFVAEEPKAGASAFNEALGWRGRLTPRNRAPVQSAEEARRLARTFAHERDGRLAAETALHRLALESWRSGHGRSKAVDALQDGPRRRAAPLLGRSRYRLARRAAGTMLEIVARRLSMFG